MTLFPNIPVPAAVDGAAGFSPCERYRYWLTRAWDPSLPMLVFIGFNPSTADAKKNDPTVRKDIGFSKILGYGGLVKLNLLGYRTPYPSELPEVEEATGPENDKYIVEWTTGRRVIACWGACERYVGNRIEVVRRLVPHAECMGLTKAGQPRHTLYLPYTSRPFPLPPIQSSDIMAAAVPPTWE